MDENRIQEIFERLVRIETKLDEYASIKEKATDGYNRSLQNERAICKIEDNMKWLWRTTLSAGIAALFSVILNILMK